jgi:ferritin-like metal-binding protein YciE
MDTLSASDHCQIVAYGPVAAYANLLGLADDKGGRHAILEEETAADATLTEIAKSVANPKAAKGCGRDRPSDDLVSPQREPRWHRQA